MADGTRSEVGARSEWEEFFKPEHRVSEFLDGAGVGTGDSVRNKPRLQVWANEVGTTIGQLMVDAPKNQLTMSQEKIPGVGIEAIQKKYGSIEEFKKVITPDLVQVVNETRQGFDPAAPQTAAEQAKQLMIIEGRLASKVRTILEGLRATKAEPARM